MPKPLLSPDGRLRFEHEVIEEERCGPWETLRLVEVESGQVLLSHACGGSGASARFLEGGIVEIELNDRRGLRRQVLVDSQARRFRLPPDKQPRELDELPTLLGMNDQLAGYVPPPPARPRLAAAVALFSVLGSLVFVVGGLWMAIDGPTAKDRWTGLLGMAFFGACAWSFWSDCRRTILRSGHRSPP